jgi:DNA-binding MarR family transcriptional regulator
MPPIGFKHTEESKKKMSEDAPRSVLTESQVLEIRRLYKRGAIGYKRLAKKFNVSPMTIARTVRRQCWKHL